jgi:expansin (peptidoglycan-binding protein)
MKIRFISAEVKDEKKFLMTVIVRSCYWTAFVVAGEATSGRCGFHHSYVTNAYPEGAATDCRLVGQAYERVGENNQNKGKRSLWPLWHDCVCGKWRLRSTEKIILAVK